MPRRLRLPLLLVLLIALGAGAWFFFGSRPITVEIAPVSRGPAAELVYATGFVEPVHPVSVAARATAPVRDVLVREGDAVAKGQPLLLLDDEEQRGLLAQARAQAEGATLAERRVATLNAQGWVSRAARDQAVAQGRAARASVVALDARLDQMVVRAGISGLVLKRDVEPGDVATPGKVLMQLGNPRETRVTATVDERDIPRVRPGMEALMSTDALPGRVIRARVSEVTPGGDPGQRAFRVRIAFTRDEGLPFGLTLEVNIVSRRKANTLLAPAAAIADGQVWLVQGGRATRRKVSTGIAGPDKVEILSGLAQGDSIIVNPPEGLAEGSRVEARQPAR